MGVCERERETDASNRLTRHENAKGEKIRALASGGIFFNFSASNVCRSLLSLFVGVLNVRTVHRSRRGKSNFLRRFFIAHAG